ncbi:unnamed protein product [Diplocarpon coronariae]
MTSILAGTVNVLGLETTAPDRDHTAGSGYHSRVDETRVEIAQYAEPNPVEKVKMTCLGDNEAGIIPHPYKASACSLVPWENSSTPVAHLTPCPAQAGLGSDGYDTMLLLRYCTVQYPTVPYSTSTRRPYARYTDRLQLRYCMTSRWGQVYVASALRCSAWRRWLATGSWEWINAGEQLRRRRNIFFSSRPSTTPRPTKHAHICPSWHAAAGATVTSPPPPPPSPSPSANCPGAAIHTGFSLAPHRLRCGLKVAETAATASAPYPVLYMQTWDSPYIRTIAPVPNGQGNSQCPDDTMPLLQAIDSLRIRTCSPSIFGYRACGQQDRHTPLPVTSAPPCTTPSTTSTSTSTSSSSISSSSSSSTGCPVRWSCAAAMPVSSRLVSRARGRCRTWIIVGSRKSRSPLLFPCSEQSKGRPWRPTLNQMRSVQIASSGKILPSVQAGVWLLRPSQRRHALPLQSCLDTGSLSTTCQMPAHNRSQITNGAYDGIVSRIELRPSPLASSHLPTIYLRAATSPDFRIAYPTTRRDETRRSNTERAPLPEAAAQPRTEI